MWMITSHGMYSASWSEGTRPNQSLQGWILLRHIGPCAGTISTRSFVLVVGIDELDFSALEKSATWSKAATSRPSNGEGILEMLNSMSKEETIEFLRFTTGCSSTLGGLGKLTSNFSALDQMGRAYQLRIHVLIRFCCLIMPTTIS